jgi:hypothetical protein
MIYDSGNWIVLSSRGATISIYYWIFMYL